MLRFLVALLLLTVAGCGRRTPPVPVISVCDLSRDFTAYREQLIAVRGVNYYGLRQNCPANCANGPWPSFVDLTSTEALAPGESPFGFTTDDSAWTALDQAERTAEREAKLGRRVEVWVTVVGRLRASDHRSPVGPCDPVGQGRYGHLGAFPAQLVVQRVAAVDLIPNPDSPYDYSHIYRGAL
jgi:hypothetical protein